MATLSELESVLPPDAGMNCVGYRVRMLSRIITGIYDEALAPLKLKGSQFNLLDVVNRKGSCAPSEIYKLTRMDKSTASRNLERMRRRGWLSIEVADEGRGQIVSVTGKGSGLLRVAYPLWKKAQKEAMRRLGPDGFRALQLVIRSVNGE